MWTWRVLFYWQQSKRNCGRVDWWPFRNEPLIWLLLTEPPSSAKRLGAHISGHKFAASNPSRAAQKVCQAMGHACGRVTGSLLCRNTVFLGSLLLHVLCRHLHEFFENSLKQSSRLVVAKCSSIWWRFQCGPATQCLREHYVSLLFWMIKALFACNIKS